MLECAGGTPDVEKDLTDEVLRGLLAPQLSPEKLEYADTVAEVEDLQCSRIAPGNACNELVIRGVPARGSRDERAN